MANDPHDPPAILMVDDEPHILHILRRLPGSQTPDYALITSSSGTEALEQLAGRTVPLVITDMGLPDMSGLQLATAIRARSPSTCIILMSGYLTADLVGRATDYGVAYCLPKPFAFEQVEQLVQRVLGADSYSSAETGGAGAGSDAQGSEYMPGQHHARPVPRIAASSRSKLRWPSAGKVLKNAETGRKQWESEAISMREPATLAGASLSVVCGRRPLLGQHGACVPAGGTVVHRADACDASETAGTPTHAIGAAAIQSAASAVRSPPLPVDAAAPKVVRDHQRQWQGHTITGRPYPSVNCSFVGV